MFYYLEIYCHVYCFMFILQMYSLYLNFNVTLRHCWLTDVGVNSQEENSPDLSSYTLYIKTIVEMNFVHLCQ